VKNDAAGDENLVREKLVDALELIIEHHVPAARIYCALKKRRRFIAALTLKLPVYFCLSSE
jgi:hypothetical protein